MNSSWLIERFGIRSTMPAKPTAADLRSRVRAHAPHWVRRMYWAYAREVYGTPKGIITQDEFVRATPERWHQAHPAELPRRVPARQFGPIRAEFDLDAAPYPDRGVLELPGGSIYGPNGWPFTHDGLLVSGSSWWGSNLRQLPPAYFRPLRLRGACLSLASDYAKRNYGHFLLDVLPRIGIFNNAGFHLSDIDHVYVPRPPSATARMLLEKFGIREDVCVWAEDARQIHAETMLVTTFPGRRRDYPPSTVAFLRRALEKQGPVSRRLFITRAGRRRITNEDELLAIASNFGFVRYEFANIRNEPEYFAEVAMIVGPHDSGLANIAFCRPGTKIFELIPSDHMHPYYYTLACAGGLDYSYIVGRSATERPKGSPGSSKVDFYVDPAVFTAALASLTQELPSTQQERSQQAPRE